jgi:hypothetical protein
MFLRITLIASGVVAAIIGLFLLLGADAAIQSFQLGTSDVASRLFARVFGGALVSVAIMNFIASADRGSSAGLRAVAVANVLFHVFGIATDFTETFPKTGGWWAGMAAHVIFILAFGYCLVNWSKVTRP